MNDQEEKGIFQFFVQDIFDVNKNEPYEGAKESRLDELSIPQNLKDELKAMAYVATFEELRKNADNRDAFLHFAGVLEKMSDGVKSLEVENPEIMGELNRASGILKNVEYAEKNLTEVEKRDLLRGNSRSIIFDKAEEAYQLQNNLKENLAKYLAKNNINIFDHNGDLIEGINLPNYIKFNAKDELKGFLPEQFEDVRNQEGLVKVKDFLGALGIDERNIGQFKDQLQKEKDRYRREIISRNESRRMNKLQSANAKEQLAIKILKVSGVSEGQINRIMKNPKARSAIIKRSEQAFENLGIDLEQLNIIGVEEALSEIDNQALQAELEKQSKELIAQIGRVDSRSLDGQDMRGKEHLHEKYQNKTNKMTGAQFDRNAEKALEYEKSKDGRGLAKTFTHKVYRGLAKTFTHKIYRGLAGSLNKFLTNNAKQKLYDGSKLQEWVNEKFYKKAPEKFDFQELEQVTTQGLVQDVKNQYQTREQEHERGMDGRSSNRANSVLQDREQGLQEAREIAVSMQDRGVGNAMSLDERSRGSHVDSLRRSNHLKAGSRAR
ncbi:predicted protein [Trichoplax adhaerens]|uniref:Uncharacterized protein n=1 Tax=Trichoplax adhaerens TaxID=10228 RepID=B3SEW4_TRIAD|nr:predicted protein [Trichoplax adhaerens]EDV18732.1 predicted protein [Trichoplax adhaerens]|eukprot:XP_002118783.1 predicted protein [Trichoplax adhaerens]